MVNPLGFQAKGTHALAKRKWLITGHKGFPDRRKHRGPLNPPVLRARRVPYNICTNLQFWA
jgi:hypothetical protein